MAKATKPKKVVKVKEQVEKVDKVKTASIFDHLSNVTNKKMPWDELTEADRKSFSPFMNNRLLSMNSDFIELINDLQRLTVGQLEPEFTYRLMLEVLPNARQFNKYIKGKKDSKYNEELVNLMRTHFLISRQEATEYLELYTDGRLTSLKEILKKYPYSDKEIEKLLKADKE